MLRFDIAAQSFWIDRVRLGPGSTAREIGAALAGTMQDIPGHPGWRQLVQEGGALFLHLSFRDRLLHSGYFWCNTVEGVWDNVERIEVMRREEHRRMMDRMFGADYYESDSLSVRLVRDPRSYLEQIAFEIR